jgi:hypothetical protein
MLVEGQYQAIQGDFYGSPKELWGFRYPTPRGKPRERAEAFLRDHAALLRIKPSLADIECHRVRESLGAFHAEFRQIVYGERVHRGVVSVHMDKRGVVYLVKNRATPDALQPEGPSFDLSTKEAVLLAKKALRDRKKGPVRQSGEAERLWFPVRDFLSPAYRVRLLRRRPREVWDVIVHAVTGDILWKYDNLAQATAFVFDPSPLAKLGGHESLVTKKRGKFRAKNATRDMAEPVRLFGLDGSGYLRGKRVRVESARRPFRVKRANGKFEFDPTDEEFEHVMAYHHVEQAIRYVEDLGFVGASRVFRDLPLKVDPRATREDNAYYDPDSKTLIFGIGYIDEAEDAETILHELGHAIQDAICPDFGMSAEAAALGEGFGDYFAGSFFESKKPKRYKNAVMAWDGLLIGLEEKRDPPCMRLLDSDVTYEDFKPRGDEHENGEIWATTLWDVRRVLGREPADRVIIESHFQLDAFTTFSRAARAILDANRHLRRGKNERALKTIFTRRAIDLDGA